MKFYTGSKYALEEAPVTLLHKAKHDTFNNRPATCPIENQMQTSFRTCYGLTAAYKRSIVMPNWCEFIVKVKDGELSYLSSAVSGDFFKVENHTPDPDFKMLPGMSMTKIVNIWRVEVESDDPNPEFLCSSSILNTSPMNIPVGMLTFKYQYDINIFNKVDTSYNHHYKVPFGHPLVQLFPMRHDTNIHIETYYDIDKWQKLSAINAAAPHFKGTHIKLLKPNKKT